MHKRTRARRGATIVFVAVLSVALAGMAAFAIDLGRLNTGVNELQTRADATALNAALLLQRHPASAQTDSAARFAARNEVMGARTAVETSDIEPGTWDPATGTFAVASWNAANAVRVTARATPALLFGGLVVNAAGSPSRRAIAWVANMVGTDCLRPWGISRSLLLDQKNIDLTTQRGVNALRDLLNTPHGPDSLTIVLSPDVNAGSGSGGGNGGGKGKNNSNNGGGGNNSALEGDDAYQAITGDNNASPESYEALLTGAECGNGIAEDTVGVTFQQPNQGSAIVNKAEAIVRQTATEKGPCKKASATDATCYDPAQPGFVAGPTIVLPLTVPAAAQGQPNRTQIVMLTRFRLMCAFTTVPQGNPLQGATDSCPWLQTIGRPATGYRGGTIVGYPLAGAIDLGRGSVLGNTVSTGQRLILVQ